MNNDCKNIKETLCLILDLQKNSCNLCSEGCTKPFLGNNSDICYNTRLINLYTCCNGTLWTMDYTLNGVTGTSNLFRIENVDCDCATFQIVASTTTGDVTTYNLTNSFFTIDLDCVLGISCVNVVNAL